MAKDLETIIRISGNIDASLKKAIESAAKTILDIDDAARKSADAVDKLNDVLDAQGDELKKAKKQYAAYLLSGEKNSDQAKALAKRIKDLSGELADNKSRMNAAMNAADKLADSLDDTGDAAKEAGDGFTVMKGAAANLIASGIQKLADVCVDAIKNFYGLAESTREFRQDMGTLEAAYASAGFAAEEAGDTWRDLYSIFGEDDRAVEAANNIARMADSQKDLDKWVTITTGAWATYQDALPVEGLAEAAGESIKTGQVTGVLADALNWSSEAAAMFSKYMSEDVTTAEDAFNVALSKCTTEAERQALVTDTLLTLYGDAATVYEETAGSVMEANAANADFLRTQADLGEKIEPVTTAVQKGLNKILTRILEIMGKTDFTKIADQVTELTDDVITLAEDGVGWLKDNADWLIPVISGLTAALVAYKTITTAVAVAEAVKTAVMASGAIAVNAATIATWALNGAMAVLTSPIFLVVAAIAVLTAGVIWLYRNWDTAKEKLIEFGAKVGEIWAGISEWVTGAIDKIGQYFPLFGAYLSGWWSSIQDAVENVKAIFRSVIDFIGNVFSGNWSAAWQNIIDIFKNIFGMLGNLAKAPINGVISVVNKAIEGINSIGFEVPDWVPLLGGKKFSINIPNIPMLARGGFTDGPSIAGEAGMEAVISFNRSVREANLGYWAKAGRLLGATAEDAGFDLGGESGGGTVIDMGGVTFAPQLSFSGKADKESVIKAIRDEYPEFLDMLEEWLIERGAVVYG